MSTEGGRDCDSALAALSDDVKLLHSVKLLLSTKLQCDRKYLSNLNNSLQNFRRTVKLSNSSHQAVISHLIGNFEDTSQGVASHISLTYSMTQGCISNKNLAELLETLRKN